MTTKFWGDYRTSGVFKFAFFLPIQTPRFDGDLPSRGLEDYRVEALGLPEERHIGTEKKVSQRDDQHPT